MRVGRRELQLILGVMFFFVLLEGTHPSGAGPNSTGKNTSVAADLPNRGSSAVRANPPYQTGQLQIHFINVGQADAALLISPLGETVLFDNGDFRNCDKPVTYLLELGLTKLDYHVASHHHGDHIGCTKEVLDEIPLEDEAFDRGGTYHTTAFQKYLTAVGTKRRTPTQGQTLTLDAGSASPVQITFVALNGNGIKTTNENDLSLVALVRLGQFDAEIGGDLSGFKVYDYDDIETSVAPLVGQVEVYKVHHHGSNYSSNQAWLSTVAPMVGIISAGNDNPHGHPTQDCLERLHNAGIKRIFWTERGEGAVPEPNIDVIAGTTVVTVPPSGMNFTVTPSTGTAEFFASWGTPPIATAQFSWSVNSRIYHKSTCRYVQSIAPANLRMGTSPPTGKDLHNNCPQ